MRDIGELGESTLTTWAAARSITAQRATNDRSGWDYLLEFHSMGNASTTISKDRESPSLSCLVQVKATSTGRLNRPIKLVNWHRLIKNPLPVFFLILDFGPADTPRAAYLVHLDASCIRRALKRIRELDSQSEPIAGHSLSVICEPEHKLEQLSGEYLERALRTHIGSSLEEYVQKKKKWVQTIGYENKTGTFTFMVSPESLHGDSLIEDLVDLSLGLRGPLAILSGEIRDIRFDIPAQKPIREFSGGELEIIREPVDKVEVSLRLRTSVVRIKMEMFLPRGLSRIIEENLIKVLLRSELLEILACHSNMSITFRMPKPEQPEKLRDLYDWAGAALLFGESSRLREGIELSVRRGEDLLLRRQLNPSDQTPHCEILELATAIRDAWEVSKCLEIHESVATSIEHLFVQKERLSIFRAFLSPERPDVKFGFFGYPGSKYEGKQVCVPLGTEVMLGDYKGTVVVSMWGHVERTGRIEEGELEYRVIPSERKLEKVFATRNDEEPLLTLSAAANAVADAYTDVPCLLLPQFNMQQLEG